MAAIESLEPLVEALDNVGDTKVFDNVSILHWATRFFWMAQSSPKALRHAFSSLNRGVDELAGIVLYLILIDRLLRMTWQLGIGLGRIQAWLRPPDEVPTADPAYETSLLGALRTPARRLGWALLILWFVYAAHIVATGLGLATHSALAVVPQAISCVTYTVVVGQALAAVKNWWLERGVLSRLVPSSKAQQERRLATVRRGSGILLWSVLLFACAESFAAATGVKINSILSAAGVGGIAIGLATKDLLTNLVGGCLLFVTNPFQERDKIVMTNLEESRVLRVGWYQTVVVGNNEEVITMPNGRFTNRSRRTHRCMKQSIHLRYDALPNLEVLLAALDAALRALPTVDSGRNFRVFLKSLTQTAIEIEFEIHFRGNDGTEFRAKRSRALLTIAKVVADNGAQFAVLDSLLAASAVDAIRPM